MTNMGTKPTNMAIRSIKGSYTTWDSNKQILTSYGACRLMWLACSWTPKVLAKDQQVNMGLSKNGVPLQLVGEFPSFKQLYIDGEKVPPFIDKPMLACRDRYPWHPPPKPRWRTSLVIFEIVHESWEREISFAYLTFTQSELSPIGCLIAAGQ